MPHEKAAPLASPTYTEQQIADAKSKVCAAYAKIHHAVDTNRSRTGGDDPTAQLTVAVNMRQVYVVGSAYLFRTLGEEPAAPRDLADAGRMIAGLFQVLSLEGLSSDPLEPTLTAVNETGTVFEGFCK